MKYGLRSFSYSQIGMLRVALAFWFTLAIAFNRLKLLRWKDALALLGVGLLGNAIPYLLFPLAVSKLDSGIVGVLNSTVPIFTLLIGLVWFKTKIGWPSVVGIFLGLFGVLWLLVPGLEVDPATLYYGLFPILATVCYAININILATKFPHLDSLTITLLSLVFVGIPATAYVLSTDFIQIMQNDPLAWTNLGYVAILGVMGTSLAAIMFNYLIKISGSLFGASVTYAIPVVALIWGLIDGESIGLHHFFGMLAILTGVYIINYRKRLRQKKAATLTE